MASEISSNNIADRISSEISSNSSTIMYGTVTITIRVHAEDTNLDTTPQFCNESRSKRIVAVACRV